MKLIGFLFVGMLAAFTAPPSAQSVPASFSITINASPTMAAGSELRLTLAFTNTSKDLISLPRSNGDAQGEFYNEVDMWDEHGRPAVETKYQRSLREDVVVRSDVLMSLKPGETAKDQIIVTKLFELSPGRYKIQVRRSPPRWMPGAVVKSNIISVAVTQ